MANMNLNLSLFDSIGVDMHTHTYTNHEHVCAVLSENLARLLDAISPTQ